MTIETRIYSAMLYSLAGDIDSDEGCFMESAETLREAAQRLDEQTVTIRSLIKQRDDLLAALEAMNRAYVNLMENGRDRIIMLGGDCDPVDVMERSDQTLQESRAAIASVKGGAA